MHTPELDFRNALLDAAKRCRQIGYNPTAFIGMINSSSAVDAAKTLLAKRNTSDGFTELWQKSRLDLTVEAMVLKPEWQGMFSPLELATARRRLAEVNYRAPWDTVSADSPTRLSETSDSDEIKSLLEALDASRSDRSESKRIRIRLRELGYTGDLGQQPSTPTTRSAAVPHASGQSPASAHLISPPFNDAGSLLARIRSLAGLPERNHEDVVKDLLIRLGYSARDIVFQRGRIDLSIQTEAGSTAAVFEVKRTIASSSEHASARRQGMDYASQTGAPFVVITDGDRYEIYDRRKGHDYTTMLCGRFQLTTFRDEDVKVLDLLRPEHLRAARS